jgi:hypothetical protein
VQQGFNRGFATGSLLGREAGIARGSTSAILSFLTSSRSLSLPIPEGLVDEARCVHAQLSRIHLKMNLDDSEDKVQHEGQILNGSGHAWQTMCTPDAELKERLDKLTTALSLSVVKY